jgi:FtsP/CotA-like multicopper oxidase with cupredoxin domain
VKIRLVNTMDGDHPMHHSVPRPGRARSWSSTVTVNRPPTSCGKTPCSSAPARPPTDIVLEVTEPGLWMAHCQIAEHNQDGMMLSFRAEAA